MSGRPDWTTWWRACAWLLVAASGSVALGSLFDAFAVVTGCADGYGNAGLSGRLDGTGCLLSEDGVPLFRLPWADLALGAAAAAAALIATLLTLRAVQRGGGRSAVLVPVPALLVAGAAAAVRELRLPSVDVHPWFVHPAVRDGDPGDGYAYRFHSVEEYSLHTPAGDHLLVTPQPWWIPVLIACLLAVAVTVTARAAASAHRG
ncbi:hypothetical protein FHR81_004382 [Actinoalloteichus hoggarensis]|uniref:Uncharacterized protein n=1 Tax=Actinoalloteichus hoggarensis TaxID=1470176 RepID=A0A221W8N3_9PSEU|nr:hypothetical protein [Actinoalloteichus hoggarensis]ASO22265.1 hypothetical protein AHOG_23285 [Actinoalloteichus hoggarensis]MBB5923315.1 hypothetical protein [Actinoalloteichus hoggarensis]